MLTCANEGCNTEYLPKTHNQKYCTDECCRLATNRRIMEKYYEKRDQRQGKPRFCKAGCGARLSRYNDAQVCSPCKEKRQVDANRSAANMLLNAFAS